MVQKRPFDRHDRLQSVNLIEKDFMLVHTGRRFRGKQRKQAQMIRKCILLAILGNIIRTLIFKPVAIFNNFFRLHHPIDVISCLVLL